MKAGFISLGCSKNLIDTEVMLGILQENNFELTNEPAEADVLIVNTCAFIQSAKEESINTILTMAGYKDIKQGKCQALIVAGCLGQRYKQELLDELEVFVRHIPERHVNPGRSGYHCPPVRKRVETELIVIAAHSGHSHAAERHVLIGYMHDRVVDAGPS